MRQLFVLCFVLTTALAKPDYFAIKIVDNKTNRGVPLVRLRTVISESFWTDSSGIVAFSDNTLFGKDVYFWIESDGYLFAQDKHTFRGTAVHVVANGSITLPITRTMKAQRLYRMTGLNRYRDTIQTGGKSPIAQPLLDHDVIGLDSVQTALYKDKIYWFWGDTWRSTHLFDANWGTTGATSLPPGKGGLPGSSGIDFTFFDDGKGFVKMMCPVPVGFSCWVAGVGIAEQRMIAFGSYVIRQDPATAMPRAAGIPHEALSNWGFMVWNDSTSQLDPVNLFGTGDYSLDMNGALGGAQVVYHTEGGKLYIYFLDSYATTRCEAKLTLLRDLANFESWSCLQPGTTNKQALVERDAHGNAVWAWKRGTSPVNQGNQNALIQSGLLKPSEAWWAIKDKASDEQPYLLRSAISWNPTRNKFGMISWAGNGKVSPMGEMWYSESDAIHGPYRTAVRVVSHDWTKMTVYNPCRIPYFDEAGGRIIYFAATFTTFGTSAAPVPLRAMDGFQYDYNNVVFSLDLNSVGQESDDYSV